MREGKSPEKSGASARLGVLLGGGATCCLSPDLPVRWLRGGAMVPGGCGRERSLGSKLTGAPR